MTGSQPSDPRSAASPLGQAEAYLVSLGVEAIAHPGGTLLDQSRRTAALLAEWEASMPLQLAGLCHAVYGTDGFAHVLLDQSERASLREVIGPEAESLAYLYCSCDRPATYPRLAQPGAVSFDDRFSGLTHLVASDDVAAFVELTAANELDVMRHSPELRRIHEHDLRQLFAQTRERLSSGAVAAWLG